MRYTQSPRRGQRANIPAQTLAASVWELPTKAQLKPTEVLPKAGGVMIKSIQQWLDILRKHG